LEQIKNHYLKEEQENDFPFYLIENSHSENDGLKPEARQLKAYFQFFFFFINKK